MSHDAALAEESTRLLQNAWRYFARHLPGGGAFTEPGILITDGRSPLAFMNAGFFTGPVRDEADLRDRLTRLATHFRRHAQPWVLMADHQTLDGPLLGALAATCEALGFEYLFSMTGMVTDRVGEPGPQPALAMRVVTDDAGRQAVGDVNAAAYGMPEALMRAATMVPQLWTAMIGVVGYVNDVPVATASVMAVDDTAYVCLVATHPAHQRQGFAEAVMRRALDEARAEFGVTRTVLHATPAGRPVYTRMGYADVAHVEVYMCGPAHG